MNNQNNMYDRINNLLNEVNKEGCDGYIIPSHDEFLSEYTPASYKRLEYITGFTGSNGIAIILSNRKSYFFTDSRYSLQASKELDNDSFIIKDLSELQSIDWVAEGISEYKIAFDPNLLTSNMLRLFKNLKFEPLEINLIDKTWQDRPDLPKSSIYEHLSEYSGEESNDKIAKCRKYIADNNASALLILNPDSICWLFNIRAHDVEFSPLLLSFSIITLKEQIIFTNKRKYDSRVPAQIMTIDKFTDYLEKLNGEILYDPSEITYKIEQILTKKKSKTIKNPVKMWKACKNEIEIKQMQAGHIEDAVAVCEFLTFIDQNNIEKHSEFHLSEILHKLRSKSSKFTFDSFPAIVGYQENGAIIHYRPEESSAKNISGEGLLLVDSGGQYKNGATTDITRTVNIGKASNVQIEHYTLVLKGHIDLSIISFPEKRTTGGQVEILARRYLWNKGLDFAHGTGHGVGSFLSVHEGPASISSKDFHNILKPGMVFSNEPGYYINGEYGIRIENLMFVEEDINKGFLNFENLTLVPYCKDLIDFASLDKNQLEYIKSYYKKIDELITPKLSTEAKKWISNQLDIPILR